MKYVHITSLGCPKNLVDTEFAAGGLLSNGVGFAADPEDADVMFINTCAFIPPARDEAEEHIRDAVEWKKRRRGRKIIVGGCLTQWDARGDFRRGYPNIDLWLPVDESRNLHRYVKSLFASKQACSSIPVAKPKWLQEDDTPRLQLTSAHFAYLKIADGCDNHCAYCSIPSIRGALRNRPLDSIVAEARNLVDNGVSELIVSAQDTTAYSDPGSSADLAALLKALDAVDGDFGIRLLYAHPAGVDDELAVCFASLNHLLPYLDMPIQHISDSVLKRMNRGITAEETAAKIALLRKANPEIAIRTTVLVGFPGETDEDFRELLDFVLETRFARLGAFTYFREETAPAAGFADDVSAEIAETRRCRIMEAQAGISLELNESLMGKSVDVVVDEIVGERAIARTYMDAPDIDNIVMVEDGGGLDPGDRVSVEVVSAEEYQLGAKLSTR
ncbi:MAG: 30S ribosomal protein S12 methylthiotransferase RimO [Kiritimatiellaeota bacterium]|nr:30S ribosomal protein S12 methylthiotransferase RimO [Kiritimatiellota bacterium]